MTPREAWEAHRRLLAEVERLYDEELKLVQKARGLQGEADVMFQNFFDAINAEHGSVTIKWLPNGGCEVNGEVFEP